MSGPSHILVYTAGRCGGGPSAAWRAPSAALLAVWLCGCASAPTPPPGGERWQPAKEARTTSPAWQEARTALPDLSQPLKLGAVVDIALERNPASRKAWQEARAAAARVDQAQGNFRPSLAATAAATRRHSSSANNSVGRDYVRYGPGLEATYLVLNFGGGLHAAVRQALQGVYAADFTYNQSLLDILLAAETAYYELVSASAGVDAAAAAVHDAETALAAARERSAAGLGTDLDVLQTQAARDQARYDQAAAEGVLLAARGRLAAAMGLPADAPVQVAPPEGDVPGALPEQDVRSMIDRALVDRPDLAALRATRAAREAAVRVASAGLWPSLYLDGSAARDYYEVMGGSSPSPSSTWSAGASVRWPLFSGGQTRAARRVAQAQAEAAREALQQAELAAAADVWTRYQDYRTARRKHALSTALLKSASASYDLALESYRQRLKSIPDLLAAETRLAQARSQHVAARQEVFTALTRLAYATGRLERGETPPRPPATEKDSP